MVRPIKAQQQTIRRSLEKLRDSVLADLDRVAFTEDKIYHLRVSNEIEAINHALGKMSAFDFFHNARVTYQGDKN